MNNPKMADYVHILCTLFERFVQTQPSYESGLYTYNNQRMVVLFVILQFRRIWHFKAQHRWLTQHPQLLKWLCWEQVPHRTTFSRRYKQLYEVVQAFVQFIGQDASALDARLRQQHLVEDKSLFKALGPVWHQSDRKRGRRPEKLRNLDIDATWSKSGYHGWVYGYGLHLTCNEDAFPALVQVETAAVAETTVSADKETRLLHQLQPTPLAADNSYTQAMRIRCWAKAGVILLTPATKWRNGRLAGAYHRFRQRPHIRQHLQRRRTSIEPAFNLIAQTIGTTARQKQLPLKGLANVRACLAIATLSLQLAMIVNSIWGRPLRNISTITAALS